MTAPPASGTASPAEHAAPAHRPRVTVAGATGFVGRMLVPRLAERWHVVALGRRAREGAGTETGVTWRRCDLFSLADTERALEGVDAAFYLVHSMEPSARLTQARFQDLDLILADNFGRAAARCGVRRILYLGGLVPADTPREALSAHLASRLEVEDALGAHGVPVTAVRAGLVVGAGGSSLRILSRLVGRLPVMLCPRWTATHCQPIAGKDVVAILAHCLEDPDTAGRVCEVGGPDVLTYRDMMRETAAVLGTRRLLIPVPLFSPKLSRLWVRLVTQSPGALVAPLVESLTHTMVAENRWVQKRMGLDGEPFRQALARAVRAEGVLREPTARSIQRLPLPAERDATWLAREYAGWLPRFLRPVLRVELDGPVCRFLLRGGRSPLLELTYVRERSGSDRALFEITGGRLAGPRLGGTPRLEFRTTPDGRHALAAVQDYHPRLPWWLYTLTQARAHRFVMWGFRRHLCRLARDPRAPQHALTADF